MTTCKWYFLTRRNYNVSKTNIRHYFIVPTFSTIVFLLEIDFLYSFFVFFFLSKILTLPSNGNPTLNNKTTDRLIKYYFIISNQGRESQAVFYFYYFFFRGCVGVPWRLRSLPQKPELPIRNTKKPTFRINVVFIVIVSLPIVAATAVLLFYTHIITRMYIINYVRRASSTLWLTTPEYQWETYTSRRRCNLSILVNIIWIARVL